MSEAFEKWHAANNRADNAQFTVGLVAYKYAKRAWNAAMEVARKPQGDTCHAEPKHPMVCLVERWDSDTFGVSGTMPKLVCGECAEIEAAVDAVSEGAQSRVRSAILHHEHPEIEGAE